MNILNKFINLENNDVCNKIYTYIGVHPIIKITILKKIIDIYDDTNEFYNNNYMSFKDYYFNIIYPDIFLCFEEFDDNDEIF